jgi:hypothetical protein
MKYIIVILLIGNLTGCAATYKEPIITPQNYSYTTKNDTKALIQASKQALIAEGFQITNADDSAGVISTAERTIRLKPEMADCGTTLGLDYLKDNRTASKIAYGVIINANKLTIKTNISAIYLPGDVSQSISMSCISRGVLENQLFDKITEVVKNQ